MARVDALRAAPRLARGDLAGAPVVIIAADARAGGGGGPPPGRSRWSSSPRGRRCPRPPPAVGLSLDGEEQRRLAAALAGQERVAILLLDAGGAWLAQVEIELGAETRSVIAEAARRR